MAISPDRMKRFVYQPDDQVEVIKASDDVEARLSRMGVKPIPNDFDEADSNGVDDGDVLAVLDAELDELTSEIASDQDES